MARNRPAYQPASPEISSAQPAAQEPGRIPLHVTADQLAKCIETHRRELANIIRNQHTAPIDGGVMRTVAALDALTRIDPTEE